MILNKFNNLQAVKSCRLIMCIKGFLYSISTIAILALTSQQSLPQGYQLETINDLLIQTGTTKDDYNILEKNLKPWILKEYKRNEKISDFNGGQGFIVKIAPQREYIFRRKCAKQSGCRMKIVVFVISEDGEMASIREPEQNSKIQISINKDLYSQFQSIATVYIFSIIQTKKFQGSFIKIKNFYSSIVYIQVELQQEPIIIDLSTTAKNQRFSIPLSKLKVIKQQLERLQSTRKRSFKWQWGFLQRENYHDYEMVKLTIGETIIILATSIVQVYSIKSLFRDMQIV